MDFQHIFHVCKVVCDSLTDVKGWVKYVVAEKMKLNLPGVFFGGDRPGVHEKEYLGALICHRSMPSSMAPYHFQKKSMELWKKRQHLWMRNESTYC